MYLHLGNETIIRTKDIIGIFDLDSTTVSKRSRDYLTKAEKRKEAVTVSYELPKSFVVCAKKNEKKQKIYISQLSSSTLLKRSGKLENL
ncbi:MAG: DUF370 domain-containing protein [Ruminococcaceae bacterium]|nr:DUF370 domain-containing protein [Oscillospiraceae bacterium]